jgi:hypothetical protein
MRLWLDIDATHSAIARTTYVRVRAFDMDTRDPNNPDLLADPRSMVEFEVPVPVYHGDNMLPVCLANTLQDIADAYRVKMGEVAVNYARRSTRDAFYDAP